MKVPTADPIGPNLARVLAMDVAAAKCVAGTTFTIASAVAKIRNVVGAASSIAGDVAVVTCVPERPSS